MFIKRKEEDIDTILRRVKKYEDKNKLDDAIVELQRAIQLNGKDGNLYNQLGDLFIRTGSSDEAIVAYRKGVKTFRRDSFSRNALALCKKILRCDPHTVDVYYDVGDLLLELDEKTEAMIYFFKYIDRRRGELNVNEVVRTLEHIEEIGIPDIDVQKRVYDTYIAIGRDDHAKKYLPLLKKTGVRVAKETSHVAVTPTPEKQTTKTREVPLKKPVTPTTHGPSTIEETEQYNRILERLEEVVTKLQETVRLDQIATTLKNSIASLSNQHKKVSEEQNKAIGLLQKGISLNIDTLHKSVKSNTEALRKSIEEFSDGSAKDRKEYIVLLSNLKGELTKVSKAQESVVQQLGAQLEKAGEHFSSATRDVTREAKEIVCAHKEATAALASEVEKMLSAHEQATEQVCFKLDEHKESNASLAENTEEMKARIQEISECFMDFVAAQRLMQSKQGRFAKTMLIAAGVIAALLAVSIIV